MKRGLMTIGVLVGIVTLSISSLLFAGSQGWVGLPTVDVWARPFALGTGDRVGVSDDDHDYWLIGIYKIEQPPKMGIHELYTLSIPIPKQPNRTTPYPLTIQLW